MNILVMDIGTSSMRGILFRENGEKLLVKQIRYRPLHGGGGTVEQPVWEFEEALFSIVRAVAAGADAIQTAVDAIALTAQRSSVIPLDASGRALMHAVMWQDTRNREICKEMEQYDDEIFSLCGAKVNCVFSGGKMLWIKTAHPEFAEKICKFVNIPEYLMHLMTGEYVTDHTYGSRSNLMNLRTRRWDDRLLELFRVKREQLCELREPGSIVGSVTGEFSRAAGLRAGIPVISAGGDQQCAAVGQGIYKEGSVSIVTGTGAFLAAASRGIPQNLENDVICNCSSVPGEYIIEANVLTCCSAFDWFCRTFYDWETIDYAKINRDLERLYEEETSCMVLPYFQGRGTPQWNAQATASFLGISLGTRREELLKALVEGIFLEIGSQIDIFRKYVALNSAYISGGLTRSRIMNRMQADIYGIALCHMEDTESTSLGALMIALNCLRKKTSMDELFAMVHRGGGGERFEPDKKKHEYYLKKAEKMNVLYEKIYKEVGL